MKKLNKVLSIVMISLMLVSMSTLVFAAETTTTGKVDIDKITSDKDLGEAAGSMEKIGSVILTFITNIGIILSIVVVAILGVKYMMGSVEEKAEYKKSMMPYIVGALLIFGASTVGKIVTGITF